MKHSLIVKDLKAATKTGKQILNGINLKIKKGEVHAILGPNGSGKSTLAHVLMGDPSFRAKGEIKLNGKNLLYVRPDARAKAGLFLSFQNPLEVQGVNFNKFLRTAVNSGRKKEDKVSPISFRNQLIKESKTFSFRDDITKRDLNFGFSGGEKKKSEILQLVLLSPKYVILDEPDSGLDVDAVKNISKKIKSVMGKTGVIIISHHQKIFKYIKPDYVHVLINGEIAETGERKLIKEIEKKGFKKYIKN